MNAPAQLIAECRIAAIEVGRISTNAPELNAVAREGRDVLTGGASHLERLAAIPGPPDLVSWFAVNFARGFLFDLVGAFQRHQEVSGNIQAAQAVARSLVTTSRKLEVARQLLPGIAARYAGPLACGNRTIAIDIDAAWGLIGPDDQLALSNRTGIDLHNCSILVAIRGKGGDTARNEMPCGRYPL